MEPQDLYIRLDKRDQSGQCRLTISLPDDDERRQSQIKLPPVDRSLTSPNPSQIAVTVAEHVQSFALAAGRGLQATATPINVLLDLRNTEVFAEDWEGTFRPPWFPLARLTRFIERSDERLLLPFDLPMTLLMSLPSSALSFPAGYSEDYQRYYKIHRVTGLNNEELLAVMRHSEFNIVHLQIQGNWDSRGEGQLSVDAESDTSTWIKAKQLTRATAACKARLLLLHCQDAHSYCAALDVAHRLLIAGGPSVMVIDTSPAVLPGLFSALYLGVVHDRPLDELLETIKQQTSRAALLVGIGGASVLQISPLARDLALEATRMAFAASGALNLLNARIELGAVEPHDRTEQLRVAANDVSASIEGVLQRSFNFASERGAWIPIGNDKRAQHTTAAQLDRLRAATDRVVNVAIYDGDCRVRRDERLVADAPYKLAVQIGRRAEWSVVSGAEAFPDDELRRFYGEEGVELRVVVFARDFRTEKTEQPLLLPPPPRESSEVVFRVQSPPSAGRHRIRVCVYHEQNLLQSILVHAWVGARDERQRRSDTGVTAEVEYTLSGSLVDIERFPKRNVNMLLNESNLGTHTLAVKGTSIQEEFDFTEGEMKTAVAAVRDTLLEICADKASAPPRYRYDNDNRGTLPQLAEDLRRLAETGYTLFTDIVTAKTREFQERLLADLGTAGATIQVSAVKSAQYVFPWALVYDHPIVSGGATICPDFASDLGAGGTPGHLLRQRCLTAGCAHKGNVAVVCPSGFWGFKHLIEQPISSGDKRGASQARDLVLEINIQRPDRHVPLVMAVSRELKQVDAHRKGLQAHQEFDLSMKETKVEIGLSLQNMAPGLLYFYCHGGRDKSSTWLGVGRNEKITPTDLNAWGVDWSHSAPLVFINGCHTVDVTPDDLLNFCRMLGYVRAAGVIGTEISVNEILARFFAEGLLPRISAGVMVGAAIREQRLALLERCNLLGLAYTPYCSSDLAIKFA